MKIEEHGKLVVCTPNSSYTFYLFVYLCIDVLFIYVSNVYGCFVLLLYLCIVPVDARRYQITWNWSDRQ